MKVIPIGKERSFYRVPIFPPLQTSMIKLGDLPTVMPELRYCLVDLTGRQSVVHSCPYHGILIFSRT